MRDGESKEQYLERRRLEDERPEMIDLRTAAIEKCKRTCEMYIGKMGIPSRTLNAARSAEQTAAVKAVLEAGDSEMLILSGGVGCGKSVAAAKWIVDGIMDEKRWKLSRGVDYYDNTIEYYFQNNDASVWVSATQLSRIDHYDGEGIAKFTKCSRLVIDDMAVEYMDAKGFYLSLLDEILNDRYANKRATVMTTNFDAERFKERYGERIIDRIREAGRFYGCGSESLRRRAS